MQVNLLTKEEVEEIIQSVFKAFSKDIKEEIRQLKTRINNNEEYLKDTDVATLLKIGKSTVWDKVKKGELPKPVKVGNATRWKRSELVG